MSPRAWSIIAALLPFIGLASQVAGFILPDAFAFWTGTVVVGVSLWLNVWDAWRREW